MTITGDRLPKNRLKKLRTKKKLTMKGLAEKLHMTDSSISMMENGQRGITTENLITFCNFFGVSSDYLLGLSNDNEQYVPTSKSRLKELRIAKNLTIRELGLETNIAYSTISAMENGARPFTQSNLEILCNYFNVSFDYMLGRDNVVQPNNEIYEAINQLSKDDQNLILGIAKRLLKAK